jgi:hypothetical protein
MNFAVVCLGGFVGCWPPTSLTRSGSEAPMPFQDVIPESVIDRWKVLAQRIQRAHDLKEVTHLARQLSDEIDRRYGRNPAHSDED